MTRSLNAAGLALIKHFEGLVLKAYPDPCSELGKMVLAKGLHITDYTTIPDWQKIPGRPWTCGWGHTGPSVLSGIEWTQEKADSVFANDIAERCNTVDHILRNDRIAANDNQFAALVSFVYNTGPRDLLQLLCQQTSYETNPRDLWWEGVVRRLPRYCHDMQGGIINGLKLRRDAELKLFLTPVEAT